ncbi:MAG: bifunctional riboflavin kinase/FAD synthetase [Pseudomonadota bacterium]
MSEFLKHDLTAPVDKALRGGVLAIGNFDGVHRGHQSVLQTARDIAAQAGAPCFVLSFEPHPRTLFKPESPVFRLTPPDMKANVLRAFGMDGLLILPFDFATASTTADDFVTEILLGRAGASHVVSGFNFHFGKNRAGSPEFLKQAGQDRGFGVTIVDAKSDENSEPISSSRIRRSLGSANVEEAAGLLGYRWCVSGEVVKGQQLGRTLGYPTANLALSPNCHLAHGIYAVRLRTADGVLHNGVASYGRRPTFDNGAALLETFIFDYSGDLYGQDITVSLFTHLRGEEKFASAEALVEQMKQDDAQARAALAGVTPLSVLDKTLNFDGLKSQ